MGWRFYGRHTKRWYDSNSIMHVLHFVCAICRALCITSKCCSWFYIFFILSAVSVVIHVQSLILFEYWKFFTNRTTKIYPKNAAEAKDFFVCIIADALWYTSGPWTQQQQQIVWFIFSRQWCGVKSIMYESCMCLIYAICMYVFDSKCNSIPIYTSIYMYEWMNVVR